MRSNCLNRPPPPPLSPHEMEGSEQWVINYYTALDTNDASFASSFFVPNGALSFGNTTAGGLAEITKIVDWQSRATRKIDHCIRAIHVLQEQLLVQTRVTYTFYRGESRQIDCMTVFHKAPSHKKATRAYIYADFTSLFEVFTILAGPLHPEP